MRSFTFVLLLALIALPGAPLPAAQGQTSADEPAGYFMLAKITKVDSRGRIDVWPTSVRGFPREISEPAGIATPKLPKVIVTLDLKDRSVASRVRSSQLHGATVALRGECADLDRALRVPVIQLRLHAGGQWHQAHLEPTNRKGADGFRQVAARVCGAASAEEAAPAASAGDPADR